LCKTLGKQINPQVKEGFWLVVSTPLKNISNLGLIFPMYGKKNVPNHQPGLFSPFKGLKLPGLPACQCLKKALNFE
jgi:hypothetical protein